MAIDDDSADADCLETQDWTASLAEVIERDGLPRAEFLVDRAVLLLRASSHRRIEPIAGDALTRRFYNTEMLRLAEHGR